MEGTIIKTQGGEESKQRWVKNQDETERRRRSTYQGEGSQPLKTEEEETRPLSFALAMEPRRDRDTERQGRTRCLHFLS